MKPAINVMDRFSAQEYSAQKHSDSSIIISITDKAAPENELNNNDFNGVQDIIRLKFDDVDKGESAITDADAVNIAQFVKKWNGKIHSIIVHCEAGVSRSAGVAAAIMKYIYNNDETIFNSYRYCPNMLCYRKVLNALYED